MQPARPREYATGAEQRIFLAETEHPGAAHSPHAPLGPMWRFSSLGVLARAGLRSPAMVAAASKPGPGAPSPGCSPGLVARASSLSFLWLPCSSHPSKRFGVENSVFQGFRYNGQKKRKDEKTTKSLGEAIKDSEFTTLLRL